MSKKLKPKLSKWFLAGAKPWRSGFYEIACTDGFYAIGEVRYWSGRVWKQTDRRGSTAFGCSDGDKWRGLASDPKGQK